MLEPHSITMKNLILISLLISAISAWAKEMPKIYNKDVKKGSEAYFNPISYYFNLAYDVTRNPYYFHQTEPVTNHKLVFRRIQHPTRSIRQSGGYSEFARTEIYGIRSAPNYSLHLMGGGYDFIRLEQWYASHDFKYSYAFAFATSLFATFGNEAIETTSPEVQAGDHIADIFIFDMAGRVLFLNPNVVEFFHEDLGLRNWPNQIMISVDEEKVYNAGTNYILRPNIFHSKFRPLVYNTLGVMGGLSYSVNSSHSLSVATGIGFTDPLKKKGYWQTGFFYDDDGSLLTSLFINTIDNLKIQCNVFPGILKFNDVTIGMMVGVDREENPVFGINFLSLPGFGYKEF